MVICATGETERCSEESVETHKTPSVLPYFYQSKSLSSRAYIHVPLEYRNGTHIVWYAWYLIPYPSGTMAFYTHMESTQPNPLHSHATQSSRPTPYDICVRPSTYPTSEHCWARWIHPTRVFSLTATGSSTVTANGCTGFPGPTPGGIGALDMVTAAATATATATAS